MRDNIIEHLQSHSLIKSSQHGFVSNKLRSCLTNLLVSMEEVTNYIDRGYPVDVIYLDFQKDFDKVPHKRLLMTLAAHGITGNVTKEPTGRSVVFCPRCAELLASFVFTFFLLVYTGTVFAL